VSAQRDQQDRNGSIANHGMSDTAHDKVEHGSVPAGTYDNEIGARCSASTMGPATSCGKRGHKN